MLTGTRANIAIRIFGDDLNKLFYLSIQIKNEIQNIEGLVDLSVEQQVEIPQIQIKPNRDLLNNSGITIGAFNEFIDAAIAGKKVSDIYEGAKIFDLIVRLDEGSRAKIEDLGDILIDVKSEWSMHTNSQFTIHIFCFKVKNLSCYTDDLNVSLQNLFTNGGVYFSIFIYFELDN